MSLDERFDQIQHDVMRAETPFQRMVWVTHGPVVYSDNAEPLIEAVPLLHRAAAVPFIKSLDYAHQGEYRFTLQMLTNGELKFGAGPQRTNSQPVGCCHSS